MSDLTSAIEKLIDILPEEYHEDLTTYGETIFSLQAHDWEALATLALRDKIGEAWIYLLEQTTIQERTAIVKQATVNLSRLKQMDADVNEARRNTLSRLFTIAAAGVRVAL